MSTHTPHPDQSSGTRAPRDAWKVVARREIDVQVRTKSFRIGLLVTVVGIVATIVGVHWFQNRDTTQTVAVVEPAAAAVVKAADQLAGDDTLTIRSKDVSDTAAAERAVKDGDVDAALLATDDGYELVGERDIDATVQQSVTAAVRATALQENAAAQDVDLSALDAGTTTSERLLDRGADDGGLRQATSFVFVLLFYLTAIVLGMGIANSVTQEKESRVVEILAAAVPIRQLLWGKVVGNTALAVLQIVSYAAAGVVGLLLTGQTGALDVVGLPMLWYVVFFLVGFVALASLWSVAGSLASRTQDLQSTTMPAQMLLLVPYFLAILGGESIKTVVSMIPVVSSMMMPARLVEGSVPAWQVAVALGGTLLAAVLLVRVGARVFERTLLRTGDKIGYREALSLAE
ncbi:ABC transporter permease [Aeromicrobium sp. CnD17-E]|uniref:ABC transporter permease n=1 Tax=Aeromicrobium sp. CnD17-E TaxID=2954487 RepID=UPI002097772A|nr:ABC transporter permease [Aeromicrobium sp. CnD17-E]MCO7239918.1 ABC transporter permease [Aeromicrobium sp. CnD17-E]